MAAKKQSNQMLMFLVNTLLVAVGIYLVVSGVLSLESDNWRAFMIALGLGVICSGTIGFSVRKK